MEKIEPGTKNGAVENIKRLSELFPQVVTEAENEYGELEQAVDFDALRDLLGDVVEGQRERYQFTWPGKAEAKAEARRPISKTMRPAREKSKNWDTTENLYIEGDNLDVLKLLKETYAGKVKLIYIDPPYNTGHDFVYDDDFAKTRSDYESESGEYNEEGGRLVANLESNGRFHSDWCSMMYPRLLLAKDLLADNGAIFVSIDDNEIANLRKLCDEIFGDQGFIGCCIWQKRTSPEARKVIAAGHEYILIYAREASDLAALINERPLSEEDKKGYSNPDNDPRGPWASTDFTAPGFRPNQMYGIETPSGLVVHPPEGRCWKNLESVFFQMKEEGRLWFGPDGAGVPRQKVYLFDRTGRSNWTWWPNSEVGHTQEATKELGDLMGRGVFDFPKPIRLLKRIVQIGSKKDSIVLDFFSGSGGLAQAVMEQNAEDNGSRRFMLVQIPEKASGEFPTLCEIGEERIRRAGEKLKADIEESNGQLKTGENPKLVPDIGFRVLSVDMSNMKDTYLIPEETKQNGLFEMADNVWEGRTDEDLLFEVLPKFRIPYSVKIEERDVSGKRCFVVNDNQLIACFDVGVTVGVIEEIAKMNPVYVVMRDASMVDDATQANFEELFRIYSPNTVRRVI